MKRYDTMGFESEHGVWVRWADYDAEEKRLGRMIDDGARFESIAASYREENRDLRAEIARLREALATAEALCQSLQNRWASRDLTIERLREALNDAADLRESDLDGRDEYVEKWLALTGAIPNSDVRIPEGRDVP